MTAKEKFTVGQRVRMTQKALDQYLDGTSGRRTGIVKEFVAYAPFGDASKLIYIVRDGERSKKSYHMDFWEPDE